MGGGLQADMLLGSQFSLLWLALQGSVCRNGGDGGVGGFSETLSAILRHSPVVCEEVCPVVCRKLWRTGNLVPGVRLVRFSPALSCALFFAVRIF